MGKDCCLYQWRVAARSASRPFSSAQAAVYGRHMQPRSRQIIIDDFLPIMVNQFEKTYRMMGNVTCAAAVAGSSKGRCFISMEEAYEKITLLDKKEH